MRRLWRAIKWGALLLLLCILGLLAPVAYVETMCVSTTTPDRYVPLLPPEHHRPETRTLMTYPEWHIVHAYEEYGEVLRSADPHDYGYWASITGYWSALCTLTAASGRYGEVDGATRQLVHVIGVSFTAELLMKALYEETLGRVATLLRGNVRAPLDDFSAEQAADYARFLQQTPWYRWPFADDLAALQAHIPTGLRDRERRFALGLEFRAKAAYADLITGAVAQVGADEVTLRMIVTAPDPALLDGYEGVTVIETRDAGIEIETPRYRALTNLMAQMAADGVNFVEIAGNDDILYTAISEQETEPGAFASLPRQGFVDTRHLFTVAVTELAERLRTMDDGPMTLEHIHDY